MLETHDRLDIVRVGTLLEKLSRAVAELHDLATAALRAQAAAEAHARAAASADIHSTDAEGLARAFDVPLDTARTFMRSGHVRTYWVGKHQRVLLSEIRRFQHEQMSALSPPRPQRTLRAVRHPPKASTKAASEPDAPGAAAWSEPDDSAG